MFKITDVETAFSSSECFYFQPKLFLYLIDLKKIISLQISIITISELLFLSTNVSLLVFIINISWENLNPWSLSPPIHFLLPTLSSSLLLILPYLQHRNSYHSGCLSLKKRQCQFDYKFKLKDLSPSLPNHPHTLAYKLSPNQSTEF